LLPSFSSRETGFDTVVHRQFLRIRRLAETPGQRQMLLGRQGLVPKEDDQMRHQRVVDHLEKRASSISDKLMPLISAPIVDVTGSNSILECV